MPWKKKSELKILWEAALPGYMDKVTECYLQVLLLIYPLLLCKFKFFSISLQTNLFCIASLTVIAFYFRQLRKEFIPKKLAFREFEIIAFGTFLLNLLLMILKIIRVDIFYEPSIILISLSCLYWILSRVGKFHRRYFYYLVGGAVIPLAAVFFHFFINCEKTYFIHKIVSNEPITASYALLIVCVGILLYCTEKEKNLRIFSGVIVAFASIAMFLQKNTIAIWLGAIVLLIIPLLLIPTAELIKRIMQMAFLYFFLLSNMPLLTNYTKWLKKEVWFDLTSSIYLDLIIAIVGLCFFAFWDKIPEDTKLEELTLYKARKGYRTALAAVVFGFSMLAFAGNSIQNIPEFVGKEKLMQAITTLQKDYWYQEGSLYAAIKEFGIVGAISFLTILSILVVRIKKNYDRKNQTSAMLTAVCILFFAQSIFYQPSTLVTPLYFIFVIFAIYHKKKKRTLQEEVERDEKLEEEREQRQEQNELDEEPLELLPLDC